ncbi:MAG TPA: hypothetical protein VMY77_15250 [Chitinophagaceae bacterium]|nr:hypothetical protein [Chitinophagaceae bacterium]
MKKVLLIVVCAYAFSACSLFRKNVKYGCPTDGRNVGAEKLLSGDPKSVKAARKAKYKGGSAVKSVY